MGCLQPQQKPQKQSQETRNKYLIQEPKKEIISNQGSQIQQLKQPNVQELQQKMTKDDNTNVQIPQQLPKQQPVQIQETLQEQYQSTFTCVRCNNIGSIEIPCRHKYCDICVQELTLKICDGNINKVNEVKCEKCKAGIPLKDIWKAFGDEQRFKLMFQGQTDQNQFDVRNQKQIQDQIYQEINQMKQNKQIPQQDALFVCQICLSKFRVEYGIYLDNCNHIYCENCLREQVKMKIDRAEVDLDNLVCPDQKCGKPINPNQVEFILRNDQESQKKYNRFQVDKATTKAGEILVKCPRKDCSNQFSTNKNSTCAFCESCLNDFCPQCFKTPHINKTCQQLAQEIAVFDGSIKRRIEMEKEADQLQDFYILGLSKWLRNQSDKSVQTVKQWQKELKAVITWFAKVHTVLGNTNFAIFVH